MLSFFRLWSVHLCVFSFFFFFNDTATTEIYTLSLHVALPISGSKWSACSCVISTAPAPSSARSEEHTSELQSRQYLVCRLLLEKKNKKLLPLILKTTKKKQINPKKTNIQN